MKELLFQILQAVIIAVIPIVSAYSIKWIKQAAEEAKASADSEKIQGYITEIANAISDAVAATSQTFVDELKKERHIHYGGAERGSTESLKRLSRFHQPGGHGVYSGDLRRPYGIPLQ